jgi:hypothetical protein
MRAKVSARLSLIVGIITSSLLIGPPIGLARELYLPPAVEYGKPGEHDPEYN